MRTGKREGGVEVSLKETIKRDMMDAMRRRSESPEAALALATLRILLSEIRNREIAVRHELDDAEVVDVVVRERKRRLESAAEYEKAARQDLKDKELAEAAILEAYLPEQADEQELMRLIDEALAATGATEPKQVGQVMGRLASELKGRADMKQVSRLVVERLGGGG